MGYQGIGGAFLYARDPDALAIWYQEVLGAPLTKQGDMWWVELPSSDRIPSLRGSSTTFAVMKADQALPAVARARLNHRVADLDVVMKRLTERGIPFEGPQDEYGRFVWCTDPEGHRVEVWEPMEEVVGTGPVAVVDRGHRLATTKVGDHDLVFETDLGLSAQEVWNAWSTEEGLMAWLCPGARVDLRIGGAYEVHFMPDAPPGMRGSDGCKVLSFLRHRMLSFTWNAPPSIPETRDARTFVVLEFTPSQQGTKMRLTHSGWPLLLEGKWEETHAYFDKAWRSVVAALEDYAR